MDNVIIRRHYDSDWCKKKTSAAALNLQAVIRGSGSCARALLAYIVYDSRGTLSNYPVASVEHNQPKPLCCGYTPDVPSPFVHNWAFAAHVLLPLPFTFGQSGLRALGCERFAQYGYASCRPCTQLQYNFKVLAMVSRARDTNRYTC